MIKQEKISVLEYWTEFKKLLSELSNTTDLHWVKCSLHELHRNTHIAMAPQDSGVNDLDCLICTHDALQQAGAHTYDQYTPTRSTAIVVYPGKIVIMAAMDKYVSSTTSLLCYRFTAPGRDETPFRQNDLSSSNIIPTERSAHRM
jgi:hypothetical protein